MTPRELLTDAAAIGIIAGSIVLALAVYRLWARGVRSESRFRELAHAMPQIVFTTDAAGRAEFVSEAFTKVTGAPPEAARRDGILAFIHPDDVAVVHRLRNEGLGAAEHLAAEYRLKTVDGWRWHLMRMVPVRGRGGRLTAWYGTSTDIDHVRRDSARLREQAAILDQVKEGVVVRDLEHRVLYWNRGAERIYGWTFEEVRGRPVTQFLYRAEPEAIEALKIVLATGVWTGRLFAYGKGGERHQVESHWTLVRDETGTPTSVVAIHLDITERVALEEKLQQAMRLDTVGELSGGLAHDFNNLLTVILGNSELLMSRLDAEPRLKALAEMSRGAAQRGAALTQRMLAFARRQRLDPKAIDVGALLRGMRPILSSTLREDIMLTIQAPEGLWQAEADQTQLENAVVSLCANARDAMPEGGAVAVTASNADLGATGSDRARELAPGRYVRIDVADTGIGIAPDVIGRVFDPFFTTKQRTKGTGLGLSMVYGFAKQSKGHASIVSTPGKGTAVSVFLPVTSEEPAPSRARPPAVTDVSVEPSGEWILVTEDDELVRSYVCDQLTAMGYRVHAATDAAEAMRIIEGEVAIDLLFTDIVMPGGMNGRELAAAARLKRPGLAILFTSGYPEDALGPDERLDAGVQLLSKPYKRADLAQKLRAALTSRGTTASRDR